MLPPQVSNWPNQFFHGKYPTPVSTGVVFSGLNIPMQRYDLWAVPLFEVAWPQHQEHRAELKAVCDRLRAARDHSGVSEHIKPRVYESGFDFVLQQDAAVQAWKQWVCETVYNAVVTTNLRYWPAGCRVAVELHESWCHVTDRGGYHDRHIHPNSAWSAIYYLDPGDSDVITASGVNRFYNPSSVQYSDGGTLWSSESSSVDIEPEAGNLVIFPSWIQHAAMSYLGDAPRYVLSCNCRVQLLT